MRRIAASSVMAVLLMSACGPTPAGEVPAMTMEGGATIQAIAAPRGRSVVLVLSPADCISCDVDLAKWLPPGGDSSLTVRVVLTRAPSEAEQRNLTLVRVPVAGRLAGRSMSRRIASPCILHFLDGRPVSSTCAGNRAPAETSRATTSEALTLVDTLVIAETPAAYVSRPTHLTASARHGLFISDAFSRNVIHVRADGAIAGGIGRRGRGPGEFEAPSTILVAHDSLLFVADQMRGGVVVRDLMSGGERGLVRFEGNRPTMVLVGDTVFAGTVNTVRGTSLARWTTRSDSVAYFGVLPASFARSPLSRFVYNVSLAAWPDSLAYVVGLSDVVYIATSDGRLRDSVVVPRSTRRGLPSEVRLASLRDPASVAAQSSIPWALGHLSDGRLVVVFADGEMRANVLAGRLYVSVLSRGGGETCADVPLPSDGHELPRIAFDGDEMLALEQRVVDGRAVHVVRRYSFPAACAAPSA